MYATLEQVKARLPLETILYCVDDEREGELTVAGEARISSVIVDSTGEADTYLAQRYSVPVDPVPQALVTKVLDIVCHRLLLRRGVRPDTADESLESQGKAAIAWFKDVAVGKASIGGADPASGASGAPNLSGKPSITSSPRVFSRDSLKEF